jgi:hypothetical protein
MRRKICMEIAGTVIPIFGKFQENTFLFIINFPQHKKVPKNQI